MEQKRLKKSNFSFKQKMSTRRSKTNEIKLSKNDIQLHNQIDFFSNKSNPFDFNVNGSPSFSDYLKFSHFVLESQIAKKAELSQQKQRSYSAFSRSRKSKPHSSKKKLLLAAVRQNFEELAEKVEKKLEPIVKQQSQKILAVRDLGEYFLDLLVRKETYGKTRMENVKVDFKKLLVSKYGDDVPMLLVNSQEVENLGNYIPFLLWKERGNHVVKQKIEKNITPLIVKKLERVWTIGKVLRKINRRVGDKLDRKELLQIKDFQEEFQKDAKLLKKKDLRESQKFENKVIGKKFIEKYNYVAESLQKRKARQFVDQIKEKKISKRNCND